MLYPLRFKPICKAKLWGGHRLVELFGRQPADGPNIGESWELSGLPGNESVVSAGPLAGSTLPELVNRFGPALLGPGVAADGGFPLLVKFLDARLPLSVQVHPRRETGDGGRPKNECWYVVESAPGATLWIGLNPDVQPAEFESAVRSGGGQVADMLHALPVAGGDFFHLPGGTVHALGGGIVVAEVQTPSDTTYRLYDWGRGGAGRDLDADSGLAEVVYGRPPVQPRQRTSDSDGAQVARLLDCDDFVVDEVRCPAGAGRIIPGGRMVIVQVVAGGGRIDCGNPARLADFKAGDVVLLPAEIERSRADCSAASVWLEVMVPRRQ